MMKRERNKHYKNTNFKSKNNYDNNKDDELYNVLTSRPLIPVTIKRSQIREITASDVLRRMQKEKINNRLKQQSNFNNNNNNEKDGGGWPVRRHRIDSEIIKRQELKDRIAKQHELELVGNVPKMMPSIRGRKISSRSSLVSSNSKQSLSRNSTSDTINIQYRVVNTENDDNQVNYKTNLPRSSSSSQSFEDIQSRPISNNNSEYNVKSEYRSEVNPLTHSIDMRRPIERQAEVRRSHVGSLQQQQQNNDRQYNDRSEYRSEVNPLTHSIDMRRPIERQAEVRRSHVGSLQQQQQNNDRQYNDRSEYRSEVNPLTHSIDMRRPIERQAEVRRSHVGSLQQQQQNNDRQYNDRSEYRSEVNPLTHSIDMRRPIERQAEVRRSHVGSLQQQQQNNDRQYNDRSEYRSEVNPLTHSIDMRRPIERQAEVRRSHVGSLQQQQQQKSKSTNQSIEKRDRYVVQRNPVTNSTELKRAQLRLFQKLSHSHNGPLRYIEQNVQDIEKNEAGQDVIDALDLDEHEDNVQFTNEFDANEEETSDSEYNEDVEELDEDLAHNTYRSVDEDLQEENSDRENESYAEIVEDDKNDPGQLTNPQYRMEANPMGYSVNIRRVVKQEPNTMRFSHEEVLQRENKNISNRVPLNYKSNPWTGSVEFKPRENTNNNQLYYSYQADVNLSLPPQPIRGTSPVKSNRSDSKELSSLRFSKEDETIDFDVTINPKLIKINDNTSMIGKNMSSKLLSSIDQISLNTDTSKITVHNRNLLNESNDSPVWARTSNMKTVNVMEIKNSDEDNDNLNTKIEHFNDPLLGKLVEAIQTTKENEPETITNMQQLSNSNNQGQFLANKNDTLINNNNDNKTQNSNNQIESSSGHRGGVIVEMDSKTDKDLEALRRRKLAELNARRKDILRKRRENREDSDYSSSHNHQHGNTRVQSAVNRRSNLRIINNAIVYSLLAGPVNSAERLAATEVLQSYQQERHHFIVLLSGSRIKKFRGIYILQQINNNHNDDDRSLVAAKIYGDGPSLVYNNMVKSFFKYSSSGKQFDLIPSKSFSLSTDAMTLQTRRR